MKRYRQSGFGVIAAIVVLVVLGGLAAALVRTSTGQQVASGQDIAAANANQAARAGAEWGLYQALVSNNCTVGNQLNLSAENGFSVTVNCTSTPFNEGTDEAGNPVVKAIYSVDAIACNASPCPKAVASGDKDYVERRRLARACAIHAGPNRGRAC